MMATTATDRPQTAQPNPLVAGLERLPVAPTALVIFGATGDLAQRKLLPALYNLAHEGALPDRFHLVGVARRGAKRPTRTTAPTASRQSGSSPGESPTRACSRGYSSTSSTCPANSTRTRCMDAWRKSSTVSTSARG